MLTVTKVSTEKYTLEATQLEDGKIYESDGGELYIANYVYQTDGSSIVAFCVDGTAVIRQHDTHMFREVEAELIVKS